MNKIASPIPVIKRHLERTLRIKWESILVDPRSQKHKRKWNFGYVAEVLFFGVLSGSKNLREIETLSECYEERLPDTTLHDVMVKIDPEPLRKLIAKEVKSALRSHELPKSEFPLRITVIDGKWISVSNKKLNSMSQAFSCDSSKKYSHTVLRALHSSNSTKLILGQKEISGGFSECMMVIPFINDLEHDYGASGLLEVYSLDAAFAHKSTADHIANHHKRDYIIALKGNQPNLLFTAKQVLTEAVYVAEEQENGKSIKRELFRYQASPTANRGWTHLAEFWRVRKTVVEHKKRKVTVEDHYYLSSINPKKLTNEQVLQSIRMHWAIENNANWICDTAWNEDSSPYSNRALALVSLMRILAYNIMSRLMTRRLRKANARKLSWVGAMQIIRSVIIQLRCESTISNLLSAAFVR